MPTNDQHKCWKVRDNMYTTTGYRLTLYCDFNDGTRRGITVAISKEEYDAFKSVRLLESESITDYYEAFWKRIVGETV